VCSSLFAPAQYRAALFKAFYDFLLVHEVPLTFDYQALSLSESFCKHKVVHGSAPTLTGANCFATLYQNSNGAAVSV
jgi:hypothetical protein